MYELIFQELRYDFQQKIMQIGQKIKDECYSKHRRTLDGSSQFAQCIKKQKSNLQTYQKLGKYRIMHMQISAGKKEDFKLTQNISKFIQDYQLDNNLLNQNKKPISESL